MQLINHFSHNLHNIIYIIIVFQFHNLFFDTNNNFINKQDIKTAFFS